MISTTITSQNKKPRRYKLMFAGDYSVGKTSFYYRLSKAENSQYWMDLYPYPIGVDLIFRNEKFRDQDVQILVFDYGGGQRFREIVDLNHFPNCHGIIFMYDITNRNSFQEIEKIFNAKKKEAKVSQCYILVGNKIDLEEEREVSYEEGRVLAEKLGGIEFFEVSVKVRDGLEHAYNVISKKVLEKHCGKGNMENNEQQQRIKLKDDNEKKGLFEKFRCAN